MENIGILEPVVSDLLAGDNGDEPCIFNAGSTVEPFTLYLREIGIYPLLSAEEEKDLAERIEAGDNDAREKMITSNLRLVILHAKRMVPIAKKLKIPDLVQEGNCGLLRAVDEFDYRRGCRFSTYASWWIMRFIMRAIYDHDRTIRIPGSSQLVWAKIRHANNDLVKLFGREPTLDELAEQTELSARRLKSVMSARSSEFSIDRFCNNDDTGEFDFSHSRFAKHKTQLTPEDYAIMRDELDVILKNIVLLLDVVRNGASTKFCLAHLERNYQMFILRYGIGNNFQPLTLAAIASRYNVTRERVRMVICDIWAALQDRGFCEGDEWLTTQIDRIQIISECLGDIDIDVVHSYLSDR